ncbi:MAG: hypothetical protein IPK68_01385 [Bdellovibrionales bacterium]|nr:hypothetical protein [Bdellovibrionales bacterium]
MNQGNANPSTQQQPTTYVEATPSPESRTEQFRRARQDAEANTEKILSEKLEESRLVDERRRLEKILGNTIEGRRQIRSLSSLNSNSRTPKVKAIILFRRFK